MSEKNSDTPDGWQARTMKSEYGTPTTTSMKSRSPAMVMAMGFDFTWSSIRFDEGDHVFMREDGQQLYPDSVTQLMSRL